jgi:hypothetical protein
MVASLDNINEIDICISFCKYCNIAPRKPFLNKKSMTGIMGGKCKDGAVIVGDTKVTYRDHPPSYKESQRNV